MKAPASKRIFDTDNALKGSFNGRTGKWQLFAYILLVLAFSIVAGWIIRLPQFSLLTPSNIDCVGFEANYSRYENGSNRTALSFIQRLTGKDKYNITDSLTNKTIDLDYNFTNPYGYMVTVQYHLYCDLVAFSYLPRYVDLIGSMVGALLLGYLSDKGGRKIILLGCVWLSGVISGFQVVGNDYISYVFFQLFLGIFSGGVQAVFLPTIIEMFPISLRTFYGVFFHLIICIFRVLLPLMAKLTQNWYQLQGYVTLPLILTVPLQWVAFESIFWYLAYKEYDQAIQTLTKLAKRNGILFESKFKEAKEFLHAKHSKASQVDMHPLLRLKDVETIGKKYPQIDMAEIQKQKSNGSNIRRFLNSLKGQHYRSTNTIYYPFDFIYSPTMLIYVLILCGLWMTLGLSESIESIKFKIIPDDYFFNDSVVNLVCLIAAILAIPLSLLRVSRRWMVIFAWIVIDMCLLCSLASKSKNDPQHTERWEVPLKIIYLTCKFASYFGSIFLLLITAELFPTSLRCTGMGICLIMKLLGNLFASENLLNYNGEMPRLAYALLTVIFGVLTLFLPETRNLPLPRSILQIEAMPTTIGKKLRSRKVKLACEQRRLQFKANTGQHDGQQQFKNATNKPTDEIALLSMTNNANITTTGQSSNNNNSNNNNNNNSKQPAYSSQYDTVTSVHDIEQDAHVYYHPPPHTTRGGGASSSSGGGGGGTTMLANIAEVPSKNITRNNSIVDTNEYTTNSK